MTYRRKARRLDDGTCSVCGLEWPDPAEFAWHECPPGFGVKKARTDGGRSCAQCALEVCPHILTGAMRYLAAEYFRVPSGWKSYGDATAYSVLNLFDSHSRGWSTWPTVMDWLTRIRMAPTSSPHTTTKENTE